MFKVILLKCDNFIFHNVTLKLAIVSLLSRDDFISLNIDFISQCAFKSCSYNVCFFSHNCNFI